MARSLKVNFTRGAVTPLIHGRVDLDLYQAGLKIMQNWVPLRYGGMTRTPGTLFRGFAKTAAKTARFLPFNFNRAQAYIIEAGDLYFRFWNRDTKGRVEIASVPVEVVTPYLEADLKYIQTRQSGDLLFIFCKGYWPRVLTRTSETVWGLALYVPQDGPYLDINPTTTTLDPSATSGSVTIVASSIVGINKGTGFQTSDVGRVIRFLEAGGRWYWFVITARASTTSITATYMGRDDGDTAAMPGHAASVLWRLGAWSVTEGYPRAVGLYEERLISAATSEQPTTVWGTVAQDTGLDDYSIQAPLVADDGFTAKLLGSLSSILWIADGKDIILGTEGAVRILGRNDESAAFGPLNPRQKPETEVATSYIPGFFVERMLLFFDSYRNKLYEAQYANEAQGYVADEISALNEQLFSYGVTSVAYQAAPNRVLWMTTEAGPVLTAAYDRKQEVFGTSENAVGGDGIVEWAMAMPGADRDGDQVWMVVRRTINGAVVRTIETLGAFYRDDISAQEWPLYTYCAHVYDGAPTTAVTGLSAFNGQTFAVHADGVDLGDATVEGGILTLPAQFEASVIVYGLRQSSLATLLRLRDYGTGEPAVGQPSIASEATVDLYQTGFLRVGMGELDETDYDNGLDPLRPDDISEIDPFAPARLLTRAVSIKVDDSWENNGMCTLETDSTLPATVRAVIIDVEGAD